MEFILKLTFVFTIMYIWTLAALKLSQVCFYRRAFGVRLSFWIYSAGVIIVLWATIFTFVFIFLCTPVKLQWTLGREGYCMDQMLVLKCLIMTNVVTEFVFPFHSVHSHRTNSIKSDDYHPANLDRLVTADAQDGEGCHSLVFRPRVRVSHLRSTTQEVFRQLTLGTAAA